MEISAEKESLGSSDIIPNPFLSIRMVLEILCKDTFTVWSEILPKIHSLLWLLLLAQTVMENRYTEKKGTNRKLVKKRGRVNQTLRTENRSKTASMINRSASGVWCFKAYSQPAKNEMWCAATFWCVLEQKKVLLNIHQWTTSSVFLFTTDFLKLYPLSSQTGCFEHLTTLP